MSSAAADHRFPPMLSITVPYNGVPTNLEGYLGRRWKLGVIDEPPI